MTVMGKVGDPAGLGGGRAGGPDRDAIDTHGAAVVAQAAERTQHVALSLSLHAGKADDLTGVHSETHVVESLAGEVIRLPAAFSELSRGVGAAGARDEFVADDEVDDVLLGDRRRR